MYKAKGNILHNGVFYENGDVIRNLTEAQAERLLKIGRIELYKEPVLGRPAKKEDKAKTEKKAKSPKPSMEWTKEKLLGEARRRGVEADKTLTKEEIFKLIENAPEAPTEESPTDIDNTPSVTVNPNYVPPKDEEDGKNDKDEE